MAQAAHNPAIHFDRYPRRDPIYAAIHLHEKSPYGQNNYRTLSASDVRRVAASPLPFFMKNRLIVFERAAAANARLSNRARQ